MDKDKVYQMIYIYIYIIYIYIYNIYIYIIYMWLNGQWVEPVVMGVGLDGVQWKEMCQWSKWRKF